jgi:hypothetical protein
MSKHEWVLCAAAALVLGTSSATPAAESLRTVRDFGATGDGRTDDSAAIQRAVASGTGDIWFPAGTYRIAHGIVVDLDRHGPVSLFGAGTARIVMAGSGPALQLVGTHEGTADPPSFKPNVWQRQRAPMIDGLEIVGQHPEADGIEASLTMQLTVSRTVVRKVVHAIHLTRRNRNIVVVGCHLYENRGAGIFYDRVSLHQSNITACHISYNGQGGIVLRGGDVRNVQITGCDIEANMDPHGPPAANVLVDCSGPGSGTSEMTISACTLQHSHVPGAANIRYLGADAKDRRWGHCTITGNVLSDVEWNIDLLKARDVTILGNTFFMGFAGDLRAAECSNIVVGPNVFDRNPAYNYGRSMEAQGGLALRKCQDCTLSGLHVNGVHGAAAGLVLSECRRIHVADCTILDCEQAGVLWDRVTQSRLAGCLIRNDVHGASPWQALKVEGGADNQIESGR